jgi:signal transduction histidine kinase
VTRPLELNREPSSLEAFFTQVINDHKAKAEARQIKLETELEPGLPPASIDLQQLRAAFSSIIARAVDLSPEGGVVEIKLQAVSGGLRIEISDQGELLSEQQRQALFDSLAGDRLNSTSLDLAFARRIIEEHSGEIKVLAGSPVGTVVQVRLPV